MAREIIGMVESIERPRYFLNHSTAQGTQRIAVQGTAVVVDGHAYFSPMYDDVRPGERVRIRVPETVLVADLAQPSWGLCRRGLEERLGQPVRYYRSIERLE